MAVDFRVINIGTLSLNPLWGETQAVRTPHATTTLVTAGKETIVVDPSLPGKVLGARLYERAGIHIDRIRMVFLTTFRACHRFGLSAFEKAEWIIHEKEKQWAYEYLQQMRSQIDKDEGEQKGIIENDLVLLDRCRPAADELAADVQLFPSPGPSAGSCGLLLTPSVGAVVIAGDAVISQDYLDQGRVWDHSYDVKQAQQSLQDILEVADVIVPGHDNVFLIPGRFLGG